MNVIRFRMNTNEQAQTAFNGMVSLVQSGIITGGVTQIRQEGSNYVFEACLNDSNFLPKGHYIVSELKDKNYTDSIIKLFTK